jgi:hypothetical protein
VSTPRLDQFVDLVGGRCAGRLALALAGLIGEHSVLRGPLKVDQLEDLESAVSVGERLFGVEPPWGVEPQTYALRELSSPHTPCTHRAFLHVKPFTVLNEGVCRTPFRSTNGSTFDLASVRSPVPAPPDRDLVEVPLEL